MRLKLADYASGRPSRKLARSPALSTTDNRHREARKGPNARNGFWFPRGRGDTEYLDPVAAGRVGWMPSRGKVGSCASKKRNQE